MKANYFIGIDPITNTPSESALVTMKQTPEGLEVIKVMEWRNQWFQKLKVKFYLWKMKHFYRNVHLIKETNEGVENLNKWAAKQQLFDKYLTKTPKL